VRLARLHQNAVPAEAGTIAAFQQSCAENYSKTHCRKSYRVQNLFSVDELFERSISASAAPSAGDKMGRF
jgi:hypothetical protein